MTPPIRDRGGSSAALSIAVAAASILLCLCAILLVGEEGALGGLPTLVSGARWAGPALVALALGLAVAEWRAPPRGSGPDGRLRRLAAPAMAGPAVLLFCLPLYSTWAGHPLGVMNAYSAIGGIVPWSDAGGYHRSAIRILQDGTLDTLASWRPLNAPWLAGRLALGDGDVRAAMLVQAALAGFSCFCLGRALARATGSDAAGILAFAIAYSLVAGYLGTLLTEPLGFILGALGTAALIGAFSDRRLSSFGIGVALLWLALAARTGPATAVPALVVAFAAVRGGGPAGWAATVATAAAAVAVAHAIGGAPVWIYEPIAVPGSNIGWVLYAIAVDGTDWTQGLTDFPTIGSLTAAEQHAFLTERAWAAFVDDPTRAARYLLRAAPREAEAIARAVVLPLFGVPDVPEIPRWAPPAALSVSAAVAGLYAWRTRNPAAVGLVAGAIGAAAMLPMAHGNGGIRTFAAVFPLFGATLALAAATLGNRSAAGAGGSRGVTGTVPAVAAIVLSIVLLPLAATRAPLVPESGGPAAPDGEGWQAIPLRLDPRAARLDIVETAADRLAWAPVSALDPAAAWRSVVLTEAREEIRPHFRPGTSIVVMSAPRPRTGVFVIAPTTCLPPSGRVVEARVRRAAPDGYMYVLLGTDAGGPCGDARDR